MSFLKVLLLNTLIVICLPRLHGQAYTVSTVKPELLKNASGVFRVYDMNYVVKDTAKAVLKGHYIITVLNSKGDAFGEFEEYYDKFSKITELSGRIYNHNGTIIKKLKTSDFSDLSAVSNSSIFDDNRLKFYKPLVSIYPYTVEYEFTIAFDGYINYQSWNPQGYYDLSIEKANYSLTVPKEYKVRYKPLNNAPMPDITEDATTRTYSMKAENMSALEREYLTSGLQDIVPNGIFIPEYFKIGGVTCKNDTWKDLGLFFNRLNNQPNKLSEKTIAELNEIKNKAKSKRELVKMVYEYMQSKTRYVSIQLGIGGLQPFDASIVDKTGYGDCKALTNYTKVLLRQVDVPSIYTLVKARKYAPNIFTDESFDQFNHAILCVPFEKDTVWLECTSQTNPFGFLGSFTDNRHVLLVTENGGVIAKTKAYIQENNQLLRSGIVQINPDGKAEVKINTKYTGLQYDDNIGLFYKPADKQKEDLYEMIKLPVFTINNFKVSEDRLEIPALNVDVDLIATKYVTTSGNRLLLPLNIMNRSQAIPDLNKERKSKMWLRYSFIDTDSITYLLPEGYSPESIPANVNLDTEFGSYSYKIISNADQKTLQYVRSFKLRDGIYPPEKFKDFSAFIKSISNYDNIKVSLIKKA